MQKFLLFLLSLFIFLFLSIYQAKAKENNFTSSYMVTYSVGETGLTHVVLQTQLSNNTSNLYATSAKTHIGFSNVQKLTAQDTTSDLHPVLQTNGSEKIITVVFNKHIVGITNKNTYTISFDTTDVAQKLGNVWQISIPAVQSEQNLDAYNVSVNVPSSFGKPTIVKPNVPHEALTFTKDELKNSGIEITFGDKQYYNFSLTYHLQNSNLFPISTEIALPPNTNYQDVSIISLNPKPQTVTLDNDGNWLAQYQVHAGQNMEVIAKGKVTIMLHPKAQPLSDREHIMYIKSTHYWETTDTISKLAHDLKTPSAIYRYVTTHVSYDYSRVTANKPRLGASEVLNDPKSAVCLEYTDLFIALSRAAGIPAREVDGYAYTDNTKQKPLSLVKDILHAWPEYYDSALQTWVMVDPTWGSTTGGTDYYNVFDLNHVAFVIKGEKSTYPIPAGGYKINDKNAKDIQIEFANDAPKADAVISLSLNFPKTISSEFSPNGTVELINNGPGVLNPQKIEVLSSTLLPHQQFINSGILPPYGKVQLPIKLQTTNFLTKITNTLTIRLGTTTIVQTIQVTPFLDNKLLLIGGSFIAILIIALSIFAARAGSLPFFRR